MKSRQLGKKMWGGGGGEKAIGLLPDSNSAADSEVLMQEKGRKG